MPLYGVAQETRGFDSHRPWQVLRLRLPDAGPKHEADTALVRRSEDAAIAKASGFNSALAVGDDLSVGDDAPDNLIMLPNRFAYLSDGDVLGFQAANRRFRTLLQARFDAQFVPGDRALQSLLPDVFTAAAGR